MNEDHAFSCSLRNDQKLHLSFLFELFLWSKLSSFLEHFEPNLWALKLLWKEMTLVLISFLNLFISFLILWRFIFFELLLSFSSQIILYFFPVFLLFNLSWLIFLWHLLLPLHCWASASILIFLLVMLLLLDSKFLFTFHWIHPYLNHLKKLDYHHQIKLFPSLSDLILYLSWLLLKSYLNLLNSLSWWMI